ncbi:MAG TPA: hypothetical protein VL326_38840 [Kofleriaceae bacterium]|nr:hypothetical protein [Kofleriaceae bacterium]
MGRFTGIALAVALAAGCASNKSSPEPTSGAGATETGRDRTQTPADEPKGGNAQKVGGANPVESPVVPTPGGAQGGEGGNSTPDTHTNKPLDPSVGADPKTAKQQARTTGLLGNTDQFDDSPIEGYVLDTPDEAVKTALAAQKTPLAGCHKSGAGVLEIAIAVDATGKVKSAKIAATSTLKDKATRDCVLAVVKKLKLDAGVKVTAPLRFTFN